MKLNCFGELIVHSENEFLGMLKGLDFRMDFKITFGINDNCGNFSHDSSYVFKNNYHQFDTSNCCYATVRRNENHIITWQIAG